MHNLYHLIIIRFEISGRTLSSNILYEFRYITFLALLYSNKSHLDSLDISQHLQWPSLLPLMFLSYHTQCHQQIHPQVSRLVQVQSTTRIPYWNEVPDLSHLVQLVTRIPYYSRVLDPSHLSFLHVRLQPESGQRSQADQMGLRQRYSYAST